MPVAEDFALAEGPVPQAVGPGQVLLRQIYLSLDPAIRGWMSDSKSYLPPIAIGAPVRSGTLSQVVLSSVPEWQPGDLCQALATWEEYALVPAAAAHGQDHARARHPAQLHAQRAGRQRAHGLLRAL